MDGPLAYHITWGTYGTRLHGDPRGTVDRKLNQPGDPIIGANLDWEHLERSILRFDPILLSDDQRRTIDTALPDVCQRGGWTLHVAAAQQDHVHVLVTTPAEGKAVRRWMKVWLGQALNLRWPLGIDATWWAEGGSVKWVWDEDYFRAVKFYIAKQRTSEK